jgi:hypothetical protein
MERGVIIAGICLIFAGLSLRVNAQVISTHSNVALGAYSTKHRDAFSFGVNQAALAGAKAPTAGIFSERKFFLEELSFYALALLVPVPGGGVGISGDYYGGPAYHEGRTGVAYGRSLGSKASIGVQFSYHSRRATGYKGLSAIGFSLGGLLSISDKLSTGLRIESPAGGRFGGSSGVNLPAVYGVGFGYEPSDLFFITAEIVKEENAAVSVNAGFEYQLAASCWLRAGVTTGSSSVWGGAGFSWRIFRVDITTSYHPVLGLSPGLLLLFHLKSSGK